MNTKKNATIAICLTAILAFSPLAGFAQAATTFSGEAVALRANALGISASVSDTGPLPSSGGHLTSSTSSRNLVGTASSCLRSNNACGHGTTHPRQTALAPLTIIGD